MSDRLELWVGPEPTVNRVGDTFVEQLARTGVSGRLDDMDRMASLGATRLRFPMLWERTETTGGGLGFDWAAKRLERLRALGVRPILGLLHHGSGPRHTNLLDPELPRKLADYARAVAQRFPWVDAWTPVNEPLTTARFSGLYGLWYPHGRSDATFVRALLQQMHATAQAMRAIREIIPGALLIQTEDVGHTSGTPALQYQVRFDNERRWLAFDLLVGRVRPGHPLWTYLLTNGATAEELMSFVTTPTPPDIIGINTYITSERFLDHRVERFPASCVGGNGRVRYADVEAVRVASRNIGGFEKRLSEGAARYGLPLAVTEAHLGCTREEQMRWLAEAWRAAQRLRERGIDVRAVTAWSAFGAFDWSSLLTENTNIYESGLWDIRAPAPRPTALVGLARELAAGQDPSHPVLASSGWWRRDVRVLHGESRATEGSSAGPQGGAPPILIAGASGTLGQALVRLCELRGLAHRALPRDELDITKPDSIQSALQKWQPWALVNAAGYVRVDDAEHDPVQWQQNAVAPVLLAHACRRAAIPLLTFSSDLVFDGTQRRPYMEDDEVNPLCAYGRAKASAEQALRCLPGVLMVRTSAFFGPWDRHNFATRGLDLLARDEPWEASRNQVVSPTYVPDLVNTCLDLLIDGEQGLWHLANLGAVTWYDFACRVAEAARLPSRLVRPAWPAQTAPRPRYSALGTSRGQLVGGLDAAIERYVAAARGDRRPPTFAPHQTGAQLQAH